MEEKKLPPIHVCPTCAGQGVIESRRCPNCRGTAVVAAFGGKFLYWGKKIDRLHIVTDRILSVVDRLINIFLIILGVFGVFLIIYLDYQNSFDRILTLTYWLTPTVEKAFFWLTIFTDLYLYYRIRKSHSWQTRVFPKINAQAVLKDSFVDWSELSKQPRRNFIDISKAFTPKSLELIEKAWILAKQFDQAAVNRLHVFAVAPQFSEGAIIWGRLGVNLEKFKEKVGRALTGELNQKSRTTELDSTIYKMLFAAYFEAFNLRQLKVQISDVLSGLIKISIYEQAELKGDLIEKILIDLDLDYQKFGNVIEWLRVQRRLKEGLSRFQSRARYRSKSGLDRAMTAVITPFLDQFSVDLTKQAKAGQLFPCIGREKEFEQLFRIISASREGVLLVGNRGVGKTAIVNGLAQKMVEEEVPEALRDKRLVSLSLSRLISGASAPEAQERLLAIASEIKRAKNIVLAIEDLHNIAGINSGGALALADVLAELLKRQAFYAIATTNPSDYAKNLEPTELGSAFSVIKVEELELNDAIQVLEAKSGPIEYHNQVFFSYDSIETAAKLSMRYIHDKYLPEKALEIMQETAAKVSTEKGQRAIISGEDVARIISEKTGVLATKITEKESDKLLNLESAIQARVIGQTEAVKSISASLRRARSGLRDIKRPIASFLFLGPTGVGKTELAKTVAEVYFGNEENMIRFDMSEYQELESLSRLIGTRTDGGILTEAVRMKPFSLLLFDEVEKAHPDILNLFLQVMDDGRLTDGTGKTIDFTNAIIIMTSNAGAQFISDEITKNTALEKIKDGLINQELRQYFRPELLNRFDGVIVFTPLTMSEVILIAKLMVGKDIDRLAEKNITLQVTDAAIAELAELGYDPKFGARPLRRVIQERLDDILANHLLKGEIDKRDKVILEPGGQLRIEKGETI